MNISVEDLFPESFQRIKEEEEANRPDPNWFAHLPPEKSMRICPSILSNPLMIFLWKQWVAIPFTTGTGVLFSPAALAANCHQLPERRRQKACGHDD